MARICLITPGHLSTNPRIVKEADALAEAGHDVSVITGRYLPWGVEADEAFNGRAWRRHAAAAFGPLAPLRVRLAQRAKRETARLAMRAGLQSGRAVDAAVHDVTGALADAAKGVAADLYVAHYVAALPAAGAAARRHGARYAFDAEDFHLGDLPDRPEHQFEKSLIRAVESRWLPGCAYVTAASAGIAAAYAETYGLPTPSVVLNTFPKADAPAAASAAGLQPQGPSVYWFSQTIGPGRGLECAIAALALARSKPHLHLRGEISASYRAHLEALAREAGAAERLHLLPLAAPQAMVQEAARFDVGLVGETGLTHNRRIALTNKQFTYLLAGVPAVMSDIPAHRAFAEDAPGATRLYAVDDAADLARALDELLGDPARLADARAAAFSLGRSRFNWEVEQAGLLARVASALASEPAS